MIVRSYTRSGTRIRMIAVATGITAHANAWDACLKEFENPNCDNVEIDDGQGTIYEIRVRDQ